LDLKQKIKDLTREYSEQVIQIRRHIHANPELSFEEHETSEYISSMLSRFGIEHQRGVVGTGIVGLIRGVNPDSQTIALRADMDALPIQEDNEVSYKSKVEGVMHACGHDVHTASLLGAAKILQTLKKEFSGTIKLIFQPGEEKLPGGAKLMIEEGVLENPAPTIVFGQHVYPEMDAGKVGFRPGKYMASTDELYITVIGKGGHAAMPHQNIDPILIACKIRLELDRAFANLDHDIPTILAFGKFSANGATNVIPNQAKLEGTFRTMDETWRSKAHEKMIVLAEKIAGEMGGKCDFEVRKGYPFLVNHEETTLNAMSWAKEFLGDQSVEEMDIRMTAEDFAFFSQKADVCFYRLGIRNLEKNVNSPVHTSTFDIDESALETGMGLMSWLTIKQLENLDDS